LVDDFLYNFGSYYLAITGKPKIKIFEILVVSLVRNKFLNGVK